MVKAVQECEVSAGTCGNTAGHFRVSACDYVTFYIMILKWNVTILLYFQKSSNNDNIGAFISCTHNVLLYWSKNNKSVDFPFIEF